MQTVQKNISLNGKARPGAIGSDLSSVVKKTAATGIYMCITFKSFIEAFIGYENASLRELSPP